MTSVTDAWRTAIYHITVVAQWNWNATKAEKKGQYTLASKAIDNLREITPDAAYVVSSNAIYVPCRRFYDALLVQNEADVYEPNHEGKHFSMIYVMAFSLTCLLFSVFLGKTLFTATEDQTEVVRINVVASPFYVLIHYSDPEHLLDCWHCGEFS